MSDSHKIIKNTTFLTSAYIIQKFLAFIYFSLLARFIGVSNIGKYTFALSYALIFAVFMDLGLNNAFIRELSQKNISIKDYFKSLLYLKFFLVSIVYSVYALIVYLSSYESDVKKLLYWAGLIMIVDTFAQTFYAILRSQQKFIYEAIGIIINQVSIIVFGLSFVYFYPEKIYLLLVAFFLASFINTSIALWALLKNHLIAWTNNSFQQLKSLWKNIVNFTWPFALASVFVRIYSYIDSVLLKTLLNDKAVGWYSVAYKIPFSLQFIPNAFAASLYPALSVLWKEDKEKLKKILDQSLFYLSLIVFPILVGIWVLSKEIILLFYGEAYFESIAILQILILGLFFIFINFPLTTTISAIGKQKYNTLFIGLTMLINVIANLILIPSLAGKGSALAFLLSHSSLFLMSFFFLRKQLAFKAKVFIYKSLEIAIISVLMGIAVFFMKQFILWYLTIILGAIIYTVLIFAFKILKMQDLKQLYSLFKKPKLYVEKE